MSFLHLRGLSRWLAAPVDRPADIQVVHTVAPVEPPASTEARVAEVDRKLALIAATPALVRTPEQWRTLDRLIDLRQAIRPAPPLPEPDTTTHRTEGAT